MSAAAPAPAAAAAAAAATTITQSGASNNTSSDAFTGRLPDDFLRLGSNHINQNRTMLDPQRVGALIVTVISASLNKNTLWGFRNDPFVRVSVGSYGSYRSFVDYNGGKTPTWSQTFQFYNVPMSHPRIHVELFDQCVLGDEFCGAADINLAESVFKTGCFDGNVDLIIKKGGVSTETIGSVHVTVRYDQSLMPPAVMRTIGFGQPIFATAGLNYACVSPLQPQPQPQAPQNQIQPRLSAGTAIDDDVRTILSAQRAEAVGNCRTMFPQFEEDVIVSVLTAQQWNQDKAVDALLAMNS